VNLSLRIIFFPLHDAQDLQLGVLECKVCRNILLNTKSQIDFDSLLQLHMLDQTEEDNDMS
jgi:hypothetical protein